MSETAGRIELMLGIVIVLLVLFCAFKFGSIGGAGAERDKNPVPFWMGVSITSVFTAIALYILIWTYIR